MNGQLTVFSHELDSLLGCVVSDVVFLYGLSFEVVNVANTDVNESIKRKLFQTNSRSPVSFFESGAN